MKTNCLTFAFGAFAWLSLISQSQAAVWTQKISDAEMANPGNPEKSTGMVISPSMEQPGYTSFGSGAVVAHPNVLLTCCHVIFGNGRWVAAQEVKFSGRLHQASQWASDGIPMRALYVNSSYASTVARHGDRSKQAFAADIATGFSYQPLSRGAFSSNWGTSSGTVLRGGYSKEVLGYPTKMSKNGYMHRLGPFLAPYTVGYGSWLTNVGYHTAAGNSGGPVFVQDPKSRQWFVAGVLVSSNNFLSIEIGHGIRALDQAAVNLINSAVRGIQNATKTMSIAFVRNSQVDVMPGSQSSYDMPVSTMKGSLSKVILSFGLTIRQNCRIQVFAAPPEGQGDFKLLVDQQISSTGNASAKDIVLNVGSLPSANGKWRLIFKEATPVTVTTTVVTDASPLGMGNTYTSGSQPQPAFTVNNANLTVTTTYVE